MGRPSAYRDEFAVQAEKLCKLGATDAEMADFFGVSEQTINSWKHKHPAFLESLKAGKAIADMEVASKLHARAIGYQFTEQQAFKLKDGTKERVEVVEVERELPPDVTACIFWLKNRKPEQWRDKQEHDVSGALTINTVRYADDPPSE